MDARAHRCAPQPAIDWVKWQCEPRICQHTSRRWPIKLICHNKYLVTWRNSNAALHPGDATPPVVNDDRTRSGGADNKLRVMMALELADNSTCECPNQILTKFVKTQYLWDALVDKQAVVPVVVTAR